MKNGKLVASGEVSVPPWASCPHGKHEEGYYEAIDVVPSNPEILLILLLLALHYNYVLTVNGVLCV